MGIYDRYILPRIIELGCGMEVMQAQRQRIVPRARGRVLEVGIGPGHNLAFYDPALVEHVTGIDPSEPLLVRARERSAAVGFPVDLLAQGGEDILLPDGSIDTVLVTFTLCTIPDVEQSLVQMRRVMKPEGSLIFCEHGRSPDAGVHRWQDRVNPLWKKLFGGCHLNRDMPVLIRNAGFSMEFLESDYLEDTPRIAGYRYLGIARAA